MEPSWPTLLHIEHLTKAFDGALALDDVSLEVGAGEIHGLLGQNGSGKSTLIKCLSGYHQPDGAWTLTIGDRTTTRALHAGEAAGLGICFVHQHLGVLPELSVLENFLLLQLSADHRPFLRWGSEARRTRRLFAAFGLELDLQAPLSSLRPVEQAQLAIVRAIAELGRHGRGDGGSGRGILVLDEATTFLDRAGRDLVHGLIRTIARDGYGVLFVSHDVDEVLSLTDRITVLRDGRVVETARTSDLEHDEVVGLIVGGSRQVRLAAPVGRAAGQGPGGGQAPDDARTLSVATSGAVVVTGLRGEPVSDVELVLGAGEVVGLTGIVGAGWELVPEYLYGARRAEAGTLSLDGRTVDLVGMTPVRALDLGMVFVPADRHEHAVIGDLSVEENLLIPVLPRMFRRGRLDRAAMARSSRELLARYDVRPLDPSLPISALSGGNQQKAVLAKWLQLNPRLVLLQEPTQGVDVGARQLIFEMIREMTAGGTTVLHASGDWEEVAKVADRVVVMADGRVSAVLDPDDVSAERIAAEAYRGTQQANVAGSVTDAWAQVS